MKKNEIVFLVERRDYYYIKYLDENLFVELYKKKTIDSLKYRNHLERFVCHNLKSRWSRLASIIFVPIFYSRNVVKAIKRAKRVVIFDSLGFSHLIMYAQHKTKNNVFVYIWNPIEISILNTWKLLISNNNIATYSRVQAKQYNIRYHVDPYFRIPIENEKNIKIKYDIYFLGRVKGEKSTILLNFFDKLHKHGFNVRADLFDDKLDYSTIKKYPFVNFLDHYVSYEENLKMAMESKCLIEVAFPLNKIPTFRIQDSIFYSKKLITNNELLIDEFFYQGNNIMVVDFDNPNYDDIRRFISEPCNKWSDEIKKRYSIEDFINWFNSI